MVAIGRKRGGYGVIGAANRRACLVGLGLLAATSSARAALTISTQPTQNVVCASGVCTASAATAVLDIADLTTMLAAGDLKIASGAAAQDIIVVNAFVATVQARHFTLDAARSILFERPVGTAGNGVVSLVTNDGGTGGTLSFGPRGRLYFPKVTGSTLMINGVIYQLLHSIDDLSSYIGYQPSGTYAFARDYDALRDGSYSYSPVTTTLLGTVEGLGNTISNFNFTATRPVAAALFSSVGGIGGGVVRNLRMKNVVIRTTGRSSVGGLANHALGGAFINDTVSGTVIAGGASTIGGLVAGTYASYVTACSSSVTISAPKNSLVGGLVGSLTYSTIAQSFASGALGGGKSAVGGLAGETYDGTIINSYATGRVSASDGDVGGVIGSMDGGSIQYSYAAGRVVGRQGSIAGGLVGVAVGDGRLTPYAVDAYWDTQTTGQSAGAGASSPQPLSGLVGLTTLQLKAALPPGFDSAIWAQAPGVNGGLPYLIGVTPQ